MTPFTAVRVSLIVTGLTGLVWYPAHAQTQADEAVGKARERALARPVSPGAIALLAPYATHPTTIARLESALTDERPAVRAVAARLAFSTRQEGLAKALINALDYEQDPTAGAEMIRALTLILGEPRDRQLLDLAGRLGPRAFDAWARVVERARPLDLLKPVVRPAAHEFTPSIGRAFALAARRDIPSTLATLESVASEPWAPGAYSAMLDRSRHEADGVPLPLVRFGLGHPGMLRTEALFHLAIVGLDALDEGTRAELVALARQASSSPTLPASRQHEGWASFLLELLARAMVEPHTPRDLSGLVASLDRRAAPPQFSSATVLQKLSQSEASAWESGQPDERWIRGVGSRDSGLTRASPPNGSFMRAAVPLVPGLAGEVAALAGCPPGDNQLAAWSVRYRASGQVREVSPILTPSEPCREASLALVMLEEATGTAVVSGARVDTVLVPFRREILECHRRQTRPPKIRPIAVGSAIVPPRKTRQRNPEYPVSAHQAGISGVVTLEAVIDTTGCVETAHVTSGVDPRLDFAALTAVVSWQYTPTLKDGNAVPVLMTVTVDFTLHNRD